MFNANPDRSLVEPVAPASLVFLSHTHTLTHTLTHTHTHVRDLFFFLSYSLTLLLSYSLTLLLSHSLALLLSQAEEILRWGVISGVTGDDTLAITCYERSAEILAQVRPRE